MIKTIDQKEKRRIIQERYNASHRRQRQWGALQASAKNRDVIVNITFDYFCGLRECNKCFYCDDSLPLTGGGIDRKDNNIGYVVGNCVPCCSIHNKMKNTMDFQEFIKECKKIAERF